MKTISVSDLRANLMNAIDQVKNGKSITITSHGKPVAQMVPPADRRKEAIAKLKHLSKTAKIGDVISPIGESWEVNR
ncbi:MAG: type II toxin-antitoxin system prevent-host-death family antitoxin [Saprospiraceae bacterium]